MRKIESAAGKLPWTRRRRKRSLSGQMETSGDYRRRQTDCLIDIQLLNQTSRTSQITLLRMGLSKFNYQERSCEHFRMMTNYCTLEAGKRKWNWVSTAQHSASECWSQSHLRRSQTGNWLCCDNTSQRTVSSSLRWPVRLSHFVSETKKSNQTVKIISLERMGSHFWVTLKISGNLHK